MIDLNKDCLYLIFEEIKDDGKSLHTCLLINRLWCHVAVPILWKDPWRYVLYNKKLFDIIFLFLSKDSQNILINQGIKEYLTFERRPLFNYVSYCKYIRYFDVRKMILLKLGSYDNRIQYKMIEKEIFQLFISSCFDIKELQIIDSGLELSQFLGAETCFSNLCQLECDTSIQPNVFFGISEICKSIEQLYLNPCLNDNSGLMKLIEVQRNLKILKCKGGKDQLVCHEIGKVLKNQAHSLIHFSSIDYLSFDPKIFPYLQNLQTLEIIDKKHSCLKHGYSKYLSKSKYSKLQILITKNISHNLIENIIEKTDGYLWKIDISNDRISDINTEKFIKLIYQNCPNIKYFNILIYEDKDLLELEQLFLNCQYLEGIVIESSSISIYSRNRSEKVGNKLLEIITRSAPINLYKIKLHKNLEFSLRNLISFFESWRGRIPLYFHIIMNYSKLSKDIIEKYETEGIIKEYKNLNGYPSHLSW